MGSFSHGTLRIDAIQRFHAKLSFTRLTIEKLGKELNVECSHSNAIVKQASDQLESIEMKGSFSNLNVGLHPNLSTSIDTDLGFGHGFGHLYVSDKHKVRYSVLTNDDGHKREKRKGTIGGQPTASIVVSGEYGDVKIE
ncbi:MAG: hypothetical protein LBH84_00760 [Prevotellaceae bacterium]|nr:hypothetical protein [Prevotellaceae bacterium]